MHLILNHLWLLLFLTFIIIYFSSFFYPNSLTTMWRIFRCEPGGLHHNSWLPPGVPPSSELPLGHHCPGAFTTHRPQLQPTFWDRETGLQVRTTNRNADRSVCLKWKSGSWYFSLFLLDVFGELHPTLLLFLWLYLSHNNHCGTALGLLPLIIKV